MLTPIKPLSAAEVDDLKRRAADGQPLFQYPRRG